MTYLTGNARTGRIIFPDLVRAFALFGIAVVNVAYLAYPMGDYSSQGGLATNFDKAAYFSVNSLFLLKSYTLFSFMFGVGFAYQIASAKRDSASFKARYWRRIFGLIVLGLLHVALLFQGDILVYYAIFGSLLFLFKDVSPKALNRWAFGLYIFQLGVIGLVVLAMWAGETYAPEEMQTAFAEMETVIKQTQLVFSEGSFLDTAAQRFKEWGEYIIVAAMLQGVSILAFFLLGLSAVKSGVLSDAAHPIWQKFRRICLPIGLIGSAYAGWIMTTATGTWSARMMWGFFLVFLFAPISTAGYLGVLAKLSSGSLGPVKTFFARGGTASLTAYLMQGLLMSLLFNGYGFGLFAKLGAGWCILIAAIVALFTIAFASLWRTKFKRGPMEVLLRRWTYLGKTNV